MPEAWESKSVEFDYNEDEGTMAFSHYNRIIQVTKFKILCKKM